MLVKTTTLPVQFALQVVRMITGTAMFCNLISDTSVVKAATEPMLLHVIPEGYSAYLFHATFISGLDPVENNQLLYNRNNAIVLLEDAMSNTVFTGILQLWHDVQEEIRVLTAVIDGIHNEEI